MTIGVGFGWFGFHAEWTRLQLGIVEVWVCCGSPWELLSRAHVALTDAKRDLMQETQV